MKILMLFIILTGCATTMPTRYGDVVDVTGGIFYGERGRLIGDCPGIENYKIQLYNNKLICVRSWNLQKVD